MHEKKLIMKISAWLAHFALLQSDLKLHKIKSRKMRREVGVGKSGNAGKQ
jgi:hypothetical protein